MSEKFILTPDVEEANRRFDAEHGDPFEYARSRILSGWSEGQLSRKEKLTDRLIAKYAKAGFYAPELKLARKQLAQQRAAKRAGGFREVEGRLIYTL